MPVVGENECTAVSAEEGVRLLSDALYRYLQEIEACRAICTHAQDTTAVHTRGKALQVFRLFQVDEITATHIRHTSAAFPGWETSPFWASHGQAWERTLQQIENRMEKHGKLHAILTTGIVWEGIPLIVHAYKFEPDPVMKVELVLPEIPEPLHELPLKMIATMLRCLDHIVPEFIATPLPPYVRHEAKFMTIKEYLLHTMPAGLYATSCL